MQYYFIFMKHYHTLLILKFDCEDDNYFKVDFLLYH